MSVEAIAHAAGGLGGPWGRYRFHGVPSGLSGARPIGPSAVNLTELGLTAGEGFTSFWKVADLDGFELQNAVILDGSGSMA